MQTNNHHINVFNHAKVLNNINNKMKIIVLKIVKKNNIFKNICVDKIVLMNMLFNKIIISVVKIVIINHLL